MAFQYETGTFQDLEYLAEMVSPDFANVKLEKAVSPHSPGSAGYGSDSSDYFNFPNSNVYQTTYDSSSPNSYYSPPAAPGYYPQETQHFFPVNFPGYPAYDVQTPAWNGGLQDYLVSGYQPQFPLESVGKSKSSLKTRRRASRSKCPCVKCCHARANSIPSPASHACMILGCNKSYTRPAHLRAHLKSHEKDRSPKCVVCTKTVMSADLFISHMFEHGKEMKL